MSIKQQYQVRYEERDTPWDVGKPDHNLIHIVTTAAIQPCSALDIGCGTGDNAIWLAQNGFQVTGTDTSELAILKAREKSCRLNAQCTFFITDFQTSILTGAPFSLIFDRGCFHSYRQVDQRLNFVNKVSAHLAHDGLWLSISGNADEQRLIPGPPQLTAREIVSAVEPSFEILSLVASYFGSNHPHPPKAWVCLMRKRRNHAERLGPR